MDYSRKSTVEFNSENFTKMWNEGYSIEDIAKKFHVPKVVVFRCALKNIDESKQRPLINHEKFLQLWKLKRPVEEIADFFGTPVSYIINYAKMHKEECFRRRKTIKESDYKTFAMMWKGDYSCEEIAEFFGTAESTVTRFAKKHNELGPKSRFCGKKKVNKFEHSKFVDMWNEGFFICEIAKALGISEKQVEQYAKEHEAECS